MQDKLTLRKIPKQKRSIERYHRIMEVTFDLLGEVGYEALNTDLIAARSGIPIGSIYQFFPNKESIVYTHAEFCFINLHDQFFHKIATELEKFKKFNQKFLEKTLSIYIETLANVRGYHLIESVLYTNPKLRDLDRESNERFAKSLADRVILRFFPKLEKKRAFYIASIIVEIVDSTYKVIANTRNPKVRAGLLSELKNLLFQYFLSFS
ncbi:MAG: TetR/AcrR family transcriptional regulator [Leptospira sp.]|nr:TetR/AcrR family transcriptional regulator [Leptospira sp.]